MCSPIVSGKVSHCQSYNCGQYHNLSCVVASSGYCPQATYDETTKRSYQINGISVTYDAAGGMTSDGVHTYQWDAEGRLISVDNGSTASYLDPLGLRMCLNLTASGCGSNPGGWGPGGYIGSNPVGPGPGFPGAGADTGCYLGIGGCGYGGIGIGIGIVFGGGGSGGGSASSTPPAAGGQLGALGNPWVSSAVPLRFPGFDVPTLPGIGPAPCFVIFVQTSSVFFPDTPFKYLGVVVGRSTAPIWTRKPKPVKPTPSTRGDRAAMIGSCAMNIDLWPVLKGNDTAHPDPGVDAERTEPRPHDPLAEGTMFFIQTLGNAGRCVAEGRIPK